MIEVSINEVEGVRFIKNIRILDPDDTVAGMGVHRISLKLAMQSPELMKALKLLGLKKVGTDYPYRAYLYSQFPMPYLGIKIVQFGLVIYWATVRWLYKNARIFQEIPPNCPFSWTSFTPYVWYRGIRKK